MTKQNKDKIYAARIEFRIKKDKKTAIVYIHCNKRDDTVKINLEFPVYIEEKDVSWTGYYRRQRRFIYSWPNNQEAHPIQPLGQKLESLVSEAFSKI
jgi:hypothetical protein